MSCTCNNIIRVVSKINIIPAGLDMGITNSEITMTLLVQKLSFSFLKVTLYGTSDINFY